MSELRPETAVFKIEKIVGQGQSATVFRAIREDSRGYSRQTVALKILRNRTAVPSLRREFETLARLDSAHCVRALGWENLPEGCAIVLEWIDGVNLLDLARVTNLDEGVIQEIVAQIGAGLRAIGLAGVFHGDLSPNNILIDRTGCVKLIDFATSLENGGSVGESFNGTPAYLAPEIWLGGAPSFAADLFALGLLEHDLNSAFAAVPLRQHACRERAMSFATVSASLLASDPNARELILSDSDEKLRAELGRLVRSVLDARDQLRIETAQVRGPKRRSWRRVAAGVVFILATAGVSGRAEAPGGKPTARAGVSVRTQNWTEISINGHLVGYAPVEIRDLPPGIHRISWKTGHGTGEKRLELHPGELRQLTEADFASSRHR